MTEGSGLQRSVGVKAYNRPIKVAYLVPVSEETRTHWILDAIFYESYTRWGGSNTLVIPTRTNQFDSENYEYWLNFFDPDFIYSYVDLEQRFIKRINSICLPISFLSHSNGGHGNQEWRDLLPDWAHYFSSVRSLSTLLSPYSSSIRFNRPAPSAIKTLLTQSIDPAEERFFPDNFGVSHDVERVTHAVSGLYETLCLIRPKQPGSIMNHGTKEVDSIPEILKEITTGNVYTFATLARVHSEGINRLEPHSWSRGFLLFVGETCKDRINFWNSRLLAPRWIDNPGSLLIKKEALEEEAFISALGEYLNKFNFSRNNSSRPIVELRSASESRDELAKIPAKFNCKTWNQISVPENFNALVCPSEQEIKKAHFMRKNPLTYRLTEDSSEIQADPPVHFEYNTGAFSYLNRGAWAVDLDIERHNNLSKYSNIRDSWQPPRNLKACAAFTDQPSKISTDFKLTVIPSEANHFMGQSPDRKRTYMLRLPSDLQFFQHLVVGKHPRDTNDIRHGLEESRYVDLSHSDKGQNLRGVISMFERFEETYKILTNKLWREALRKYGQHESVKESQIHGLIPTDKNFTRQYANKIKIEQKTITRYIQAALADSLEYLVERKVLFQLHRWRCHFCGHMNAKSIDDIKKENECSICRAKYFAPIDLSWGFKFNSFVTNSLVTSNGLTVLWALGHLHDSLFQGSFYYLPEANLFYEEGGEKKREEIDILSVGNGKFLVGEVKKTATSFLRKDGEIAKFITKVNALKPSVALLIFEQFAVDAAEVEQVKVDLNKVRDMILKKTGLDSSSLSIVVASEERKFDEYGHDFGVTGPRLRDKKF